MCGLRTLTFHESAHQCAVVCRVQCIIFAIKTHRHEDAEGRDLIFVRIGNVQWRVRVWYVPSSAELISSVSEPVPQKERERKRLYALTGLLSNCV